VIFITSLGLKYVTNEQYVMNITEDIKSILTEFTLISSQLMVYLQMKILKNEGKSQKQLMAMSCLARFKPTKFWPLHYNIGVTISSILFGWSVNSLKLRDKLIDLSYAVPYDSTDELMVFANGPAKLMPIKKKWLEETIDGTFEGIPCKITKYYDEALTTQYGDYMKIPDENNRIDNHSFNSYYFKKDKK